MNGDRAIIVSFLFGLSLLICGCKRGTHLNRLPVHGTVTINNGEKLRKGSIVFQPAQGRSGPSATASVKDGVYGFTREDGPTAGGQTVRIVRNESGRIPAKVAPMHVASGKSHWELNEELVDDGVYVHNFKLKN